VCGKKMDPLVKELLRKYGEVELVGEEPTAYKIRVKHTSKERYREIARELNRLYAFNFREYWLIPKD